MTNWRKLIAMDTSKKLAAVAVVVAVGFGVVLADALGSPSTPQRAGTQTIDAATDPDAAAKALNDYCAQIENCKFVGTPEIKTAYSDRRVLGDALYNCSNDAFAEDSVAVSDERSESTDLSASLSSKISTGLIGFGKVSVQAEVDSHQLEEKATTTTHTNEVTVPPGWKGWTDVRVATASVNAVVQITNQGQVIDITNFRMSYPGFLPFGSTEQTAVQYSSNKQEMNPKDVADHCNGLNATAKPPGSGVAAVGHRPADTVDVHICTSSHEPITACKQLEMGATAPPALRGTVEVMLSRNGHTYATGTAAASFTHLTLTSATGQTVPPGAYELTLGARDRVTIIPVELS